MIERLRKRLAEWLNPTDELVEAMDALRAEVEEANRLNREIHGKQRVSIRGWDGNVGGKRKISGRIF